MAAEAACGVCTCDAPYPLLNFSATSRRSLGQPRFLAHNTPFPGRRRRPAGRRVPLAGGRGETKWPGREKAELAASSGGVWGGARCLAQGAGRGDVSGRPGRAVAVAAAAAAVVVAAALAVVAAPGRRQQQRQQQPGGE